MRPLSPLSVLSPPLAVMSDADRRSPQATRAHRCRLRKAKGKRVLRDLEVDKKPFDEMLKAMGLSPDHLKDQKRVAKEAAQILNDLARRWSPHKS